MSEPSKANLSGTDRFTVIFGYGIGALIDGWLLMLAVGLAVGSGAKIPAFGYWVCVFFAFVIAQIVGTSLVSTTLKLNNLGK